MWSRTRAGADSYVGPSLACAQISSTMRWKRETRRNQRGNRINIRPPRPAENRSIVTDKETRKKNNHLKNTNIEVELGLSLNVLSFQPAQISAHRPLRRRIKRELTIDDLSFGKKGKVLRVLPSGRWLPRNQGWLNFWESKLVTVRKSLHRSCWTELTCQGILLP